MNFNKTRLNIWIDNGNYNQLNKVIKNNRLFGAKITKGVLIDIALNNLWQTMGDNDITLNDVVLMLEQTKKGGVNNE